MRKEVHDTERTGPRADGISSLMADVALDVQAELGEGPIWDCRTGQLYWVDIFRREVHRYTPDTGEDEVFSVGQCVGTVVPRQKGGVVVALRDGMYHLDTSTGSLRLLADPMMEAHDDLFPSPVDMRFNDGKCDPLGRFWAGSSSMNCDVPKAGKMYRMDADHSVRVMLTGLTASNGLVWTADGKTMYLIESAEQSIWGFDFDSRKGEISRKRTAIIIPVNEGVPDGMSIDACGMLWVALFGGGKVCCYDPASGEKRMEILVPVSRVTSCAFGGESLDKLYITTARIGLDASALAREPLAGALFVAEPGTTGIEASPYRD